MVVPHSISHSIHLLVIIISGWWRGTFLMFHTMEFYEMDYDFPYGNNMAYSGLMDFNGCFHNIWDNPSQLTNSIIFQRGRSTTNQTVTFRIPICVALIPFISPLNAHIRSY